jgi:hypothetical protein
MTNYQLAKVIQMAGGLKSRKRIQKTVHLLQAAGCDFDLEYRLHYYGPYSSALAERLDVMSSKGILLESEQPTEVGTQYNYELRPELLESLESYEKTTEGGPAKAGIERFRGLLAKLREARPRVLELASTITFFYETGGDWELAQKQAADFKAESLESPMMREARQLAEDVVGFKDAEHR